MSSVLSKHLQTQARALPGKQEPAIIRPARPSDALLAAELIYLPMGLLADHLFGDDDPGRARQVLQKLFVKSSNRFSHQFCDVLEVEDKVAGLLLAYPGHLLGELAIPTGKQLQEILGWGGMFRLLRRSLPLTTGREAEPDEFYIYTLSVFPDFQNQGLGADLLTTAELKALSAGLRKCSLGVTISNQRAQRFYKKHGYHVVETIATPALDQRISYPGVHRMVKQLSSTTLS